MRWVTLGDPLNHMELVQVLRHRQFRENVDLKICIKFQTDIRRYKEKQMREATLEDPPNHMELVPGVETVSFEKMVRPQILQKMTN